MRPDRSYSGQHLVQGVVHRGLLFHVERIHGAHQNFERIARKRFLTLVRQSQTDASPIRLGSLSDQVPACFERLEWLAMRCHEWSLETPRMPMGFGKTGWRGRNSGAPSIGQD